VMATVMMQGSDMVLFGSFDHVAVWLI
jgi:hypothetical protein